MTRRAWPILCLLALSCAPVYATGANPYQTMLAKIAGAKTYKASIDLAIDLEPVSGQGGGNTIHATMSVSMKQPNLMLMSIQGMMGGIIIDSDGQKLYTYSAMANQYSVQPASKSLENTLLQMGVDAVHTMQTGTSKIGKEKVLVLQGAVPNSGQADGKITLYIGAKDGLPKKIVIASTRGAGAQASFHVTQSLTYVSQQLDTPIPASTFTFHPAADASKVSSLGGAGGSAFGGFGM